MFSNVHTNSLNHFLLIAAFAVVAMLPAYYNGVPGGNDQGQHYQFAWTIYNAVQSGEVYPSLAGETNRGFGDVGLRFYPPLTYYALAAGYFVTRDWFFASLIIFTLAFFIGGVGVYLWTREEFDARYGLTAALLYTFAPYHLNQLYNNGLFAEFFAMAVMPYCFLYVTRVCRSGRFLNILGLAASYALLILSHLPMTILCSVAMPLFALLLLKKATAARTVGKLFAAALSSVAMTAFYWSRWLPELAWIKHASPKYFSTTWDYRENFLLRPDHFLKFGEDALNLWLADIFLFATILIAVPTFIYLFRDVSLRSKKYTIASALVMAFAAFMTTPASAFLWNELSFLQKVQFPWRWTAIVTMFAAVIAPLGIIRASDAMKDRKRVLLPAALGLTFVVFVFTAAFLVKGAVYTSRSELNTMVLFIPDSEGCECWWPTWADRTAFGQTEKVAASGRGVDVAKWSASEKTFDIEGGDPVSATVRSFYYPLWQAEVNGLPLAVEPDKNGVIQFAVPAAESRVTLTFREPDSVKIATIVSIAAWLILLALGVAFLLKSRNEPMPTAL